MYGVFPGRPQSFRYQRRPVDDCSPELGVMTQDGETRGGTFHGEMDQCTKSQDWTTRNAVIYPNVTRRTNERKAQSKQRTRAGSLAIVDKPQVTRVCIPRAFLACKCRVVSGVTFVMFCFAFVFLLSLKPRPFFQSFFDTHALRQPNAVS